MLKAVEHLNHRQTADRDEDFSDVEKSFEQGRKLDDY